ncbi:TPA: hypothetical protein LOH02_001614 [Escherichia coli]|nr:hypothetical protein [Escherichia coli]
MSEYVELAYAAATSRLCLFTGTGFSKAVSNGEAPTWKELLKKVCSKVHNAKKLEDTLFPDDGVRLGNGQYCTASLFFEQAKSSQ